MFTVTHDDCVSVQVSASGSLSPKGPSNPGGRLNKKDGLTRYGDSHVKDKTS